MCNGRAGDWRAIGHADSPVAGDGVTVGVGVGVRMGVRVGVGDALPLAN